MPLICSDRRSSANIKRPARFCFAMWGALMLCTTVSSARAETPAAASNGPRCQPTVFRLALNERAEFHGLVTADSSPPGYGAAIVYGPGLVGALITLGVQSAVVGVQTENRKTREVTEADKVLAGHAHIFEMITLRQIVTKALAQYVCRTHVDVIELADSASGSVVIDMSPSFALTQDKRAVLMDNTFTLRKPDSASPEGNRYAVRVLSENLTTEDPDLHWSEQDGRKLIETSALLLAESMGIAVEGNPQATGTAKFQSMRYRLGESSQVERVQWLAKGCGRILVRNLRGVLISIPAANILSESLDPHSIMSCYRTNTQ